MFELIQIFPTSPMGEKKRKYRTNTSKDLMIVHAFQIKGDCKWYYYGSISR